MKKKHRRRSPYPFVALATSLVALCVGLLCHCAGAPAMPAKDGFHLELSRSNGSLAAGHLEYADTLQLLWFGSGCHVIQLGPLSVLTDPFVTNGVGLFVAKSDPNRVASTFGRISPPAAVIINHSHFDHFLDAYAAMSQPTWVTAAVPMYGGQTAMHLLAGWQDEGVNKRSHALKSGIQTFDVPGVPAGCRLTVTAYPSRHAPHMKCGITLRDGSLDTPRTSVPNGIVSFPAGEVYNYLLELRNGTTSFRVFLLGAIAELSELPDSLPPAGTTVDVALICAPGASFVSDYPAEHLNRLKPRHIVMSHFNTFWKENQNNQMQTLGMDSVKLADQIQSIQDHLKNQRSARFEKLHVPALTQMEPNGTARNVILIR